MSKIFHIAVASDHAGFLYKDALADHLRAQGHCVTDLGCANEDSVDYPDFGKALGQTLEDGEVDFGLAVCGSGIGISIAVNRYDGARAALCHTVDYAEMSRRHNDANVLALGSRMMDLDTAKQILQTFLTTEFEGGRHARRVAKLIKGKTDA